MCLCGLFVIRCVMLCDLCVLFWCVCFAFLFFVYGCLSVLFAIDCVMLPGLRFVLLL